MAVVQRLRNLFTKVRNTASQELDNSTVVKLDSTNITRDNDFQNLLETCRNPKEVKSLTVIETKICTIPQFIGAFSNVTVINFSGNKIEFIPWSIVLLEKLEDVNLSRNAIKVIPPVMCHLRKLRTLDLSFNALTQLPTDLLNLKQLKVLNVEGNIGIISPSYEVCLNGRDAIFGALHVRTGRSNKWAKWKPYYQGDFTCLKTLLELCIDCILESNVDFLSATNIPPTVKNYLTVTETQQKTNLPQLFKCSSCSRYFSKSHLFENHDCQYIGHAKTVK